MYLQKKEKKKERKGEWRIKRKNTSTVIIFAHITQQNANTPSCQFNSFFIFQKKKKRKKKKKKKFFSFLSSNICTYRLLSTAPKTIRTTNAIITTTIAAAIEMSI